MTDTNAKMLERVRALLAKADSTEFEEEAKAFRDKADELMTAYAISQWQVDAAQAGKQERPKPTDRLINISWWYRDSPVKDPLLSMMGVLANHCRVKIVYHVIRDRSLPVVGLEADLDYFDMLFTSLMLQLSRQLEPKFNDLLTEAENIVVFKEAGLPWREIAKLIGRPEFVLPDGKVKDSGYMGRVYKNHCIANNIATVSANPKTYQRNFAFGFVSGVTTQLANQHARSEEKHGSGMELVLRDIRVVVNDHAHQLFGRDTRVTKYRRDSRKEDWAARTAGHEAGRKADVAGHQDRRMGSRKQIEG